MQEFVAFSIVIVLVLAAYWSLVIYPGSARSRNITSMCVPCRSAMR